MWSVGVEVEQETRAAPPKKNPGSAPGPNTTLTNKMMLFAKSRRPYKRDPWINIAKLINVSIEQAKRSTRHKIGVVSLHWSTV